MALKKRPISREQAQRMQALSVLKRKQNKIRKEKETEERLKNYKKISTDPSLQ